MKLSKLILGTVQFGIPYGINNLNGKPTTDQVFEILEKAYQSGVRLLDTAEVYGNAHELIGNYHNKHPENIFDVITKIPANSCLEDIESKLQKYLDDLQVDKLDTLMFHSFKNYEENRSLVSSITRLKLQDKIKYSGVSVYNNYELEKVIADDEIDLIQLPFNILDNYYLRGELIEKAKKRNKIIHTRSAFLQGVFFKDPFDENPVVKDLRDELIQINNIAHDCKIPVSTLALSYCLSQQNIDNVLIGVDTLDQLINNMSVENYNISIETIKMINKIKTKNVNLLNPSSWA